MSLIDKINKLEKFEIIDSAIFCKDLRALRNHLVHEYRDMPEVKADLLNEAYSMTQVLLDQLEKIQVYVGKLKRKER